jgi:FKBP-type peptidyl-prolyl cis-trans isomerase FkpA
MKRVQAMNTRVKAFFRRSALASLLAASTACQPPADDPAIAAAREAGERFLQENGQKPEVVTTASGLQYQVQQPGTGASPQASDTVVVNYRGTFVSGEEFDSGEAVSFPLDGVIRGWTEGLQLMKEGARFRFFVPPDLGYGEGGAGGLIPPGATLIFDVELVKVGGSAPAP